MICSCKEDLTREFEMKYMGLMHYFLGLEVWQGDGELFVSQGKYATEILQIFHMDNCKPITHLNLQIRGRIMLLWVRKLTLPFTSNLWVH